MADQAEVNEVPCITTNCPWQPYFFGRKGDPAKGFTWTYHFFWGLEDVIAIGAERSSLGDVARRRAEAMDLSLTGDRSPERGFFFRSDHFPFAREGVPAIKIEHGTRFRNRTAQWGEHVLREYEDRRYHRPADEYDADADLAGAVQQARLALAIGFDVAQADSMPDWYPDSEFQRPP